LREITQTKDFADKARAIVPRLEVNEFDRRFLQVIEKYLATPS
jgi:hypothetical protein